MFSGHLSYIISKELGAAAMEADPAALELVERASAAAKNGDLLVS